MLNFEKLFILAVFLTSVNTDSFVKSYEPNWDSLDTRPLPPWFDEAKIGIFLHWGVYSVPGFGSEWFWWFWKGKAYPDYVEYVQKNYPPDFSYQEFAKDFRAELFDPYYWADIFKAAGAKYVVLTSKHHEGYALWPSKYFFSWNSKDVGPHKDLIGDLASAIRNKTDIRFGLYHSLFEWFNPLYLADQKNNYSTRFFVDNKVYPEMVELVNNYHPEIIWSDGEWDAPDTYWRSTEFLAWLYNDSPVKNTVVVNDRWGTGTACQHGDFYNCADRYNPGTLQPHKWENAMTVDKKSWGHRRNMKSTDILTESELIKQIAVTVSCGGNILINVGPSKEGTIDPIFEERLRNIGFWLNVNGEAIYASKPWKHQNDTINGNVWYTSKNRTIYAIVLKWPHNNTITLGDASKLFKVNSTTASLLGSPGLLQWSLQNSGKAVSIRLPDKGAVSSRWAWVVKIKNRPQNK